LVAIAQALHAAWNDTASLALLPLASHPDDRVRLAVTRALPGGVERNDVQQKVADALMGLADDDSSEIRDWAVFGLASILDVDTPAVRETLRSHLFDSDLTTRLEALIGLAERRDPAALDLIRDELHLASPDRMAVDAARAYADPSLLPLLEVLATNGWSEDP